MATSKKFKEELKDQEEIIKAVGARNELEIIDEMGQERESTGAEAVIEVSQALEKQADRKRDDDLTKLDKASQYKLLDYYRLLAGMFVSRCEDQEFPTSWYWHVGITDKGVVMFLVSPDKRRFTRAITPSGESKFDLRAVEQIIESAWVAINKWDDEHKPKEGLILGNPNPKS